MRYRCLLPLLMTLPLGAQVVRDNGFVYGADFGQWSITGQGQTQGILNIQPASLCNTSSGGYSFPAFAINRPITITDAVPGQNETVTVTSMETNASGCIVTTQPMQHLHQTYSISSGTAGLQEAIDFSGSAQPALIILTPQWLHEHGNTGMITAAHGTVGISILDQTTAVPGAYLWNGTQYVLQDASSDFTARALAQAAQTTANTALANAATAQAAANLAQTTANAAQASANLALAQLAAQNVIIISGTDLGAQDCTVDAQYAGTPAIFQVTAPGTFLSAPCTSAGHTLQIKAPVTMTSTGTLGSGATVECDGAASIISSTIAPGAAIFDITGTTGATVQGCTVQANYNVLTSTNTRVIDTTLTHDYVHNGGLFQQQGAAANDPSLRLHITDSKAVCDAFCGIVAVLSYGASQQALIDNDQFDKMYHGVELYANTSSGLGAAAFPTEAQILTSGLSDDIVSNINCGTIGASCVWHSVGARITVANSRAQSCGDVCFDVEGGTHNIFTGNAAANCAAGCFTSFYSGYGNSFVVNEVDDCSNMIHVYNSSVTPSVVQDLTIAENKYRCSTGGIALYVEATQGTNVVRNDLLNGTEAFPTYESAWAYEDNKVKWTVAVPSAQGQGGSPGYGFAGLVMPNVQDGTYLHALRNKVYSTVAQTVPALNIGISNPNGGQSVTVDGNITQGWPNPVNALNSGNNPATFDQLNLRNNQFDNCAVTVTGNFNVTKFGNYIGTSGAPCN